MSGVVGATMLGGCSKPRPGGDASAATLTLQFDDVDGTLRERYVLDPDETRVPWDEEAFAAALNGSTYTTQHRTPFPVGGDEPRYARHDGTFYRLDQVVTGEKAVTRPVLRLFEVGDPDDLDSVPAHVSKSGLPPADEHAVQIAHFAARARGNGGGVPWELVERGGYVFRNPSAMRASTFLDDSAPGHVEYRDRIWRVEIARERFHEAVYRADVDAVAATDAEMEAVLRAVYVDARVDPNALSTEERDLLRTARHETYTASPPFPSPLVSLLKRLDQRAYVDGDVSNDAVGDSPSSGIVTYGDRYLRYHLSLG